VIGLVNGDSKQGLSTATVDGPVTTDNEQQVVAQPISPPPAPGWDVLARSDGSMAIRLAADHTSNLNALAGTLGGGNAHAGTPVGLFGWGGGKANETWYLKPVPYFNPGS
jgi:hypothetical protein